MFDGRMSVYARLIVLLCFLHVQLKVDFVASGSAFCHAVVLDIKSLAK